MDNINVLPTAEEQELIERNLQADVRQLALRLKPMEGVRNDYVLRQIAGRQAIRRKVPSWSAVGGLVFPQHLSIEQCSSEATATYKAGLAEGNWLIDVTGGFGVDFAFMSRRFERSTYVERQAELAAIAKHNMPLLGLTDADIVCADGAHFLSSMQGEASCIFIDPARRSESGSKTVLLADCTPDLTELEPLLLERAPRVVAKLSPMLDISDALARLRSISQVHVVSVDGECKELLLIMERSGGDANIVTANITSGGTELFAFTPGEERDASPYFAPSPQQYLYEPNASVLKAGAFKSIAVKCGVSKIAPNSHLYTSDELCAAFPGRRFRIVSCYGFGKSDMSALRANVEQANVAVRNFDLRPEELRKRLKIKDGGSDYIFATTLAEGKRVMIHCQKV